MDARTRLRRQKQAIVRAHARPETWRGLGQVATTLIPLGLLWWAAIESVAVSWWLTAAVMTAMSLFYVRVFALLHECGHGSLCRSRWLNRGAGFVFGVLSGMPQYVWSRHHDYHHRTNGDWERYRGPLTTLAVDEYAALSAAQQRSYRRARHLAFAPLGGFVYLIFNPRFNWLRGSLSWFVNRVRGRPTQPSRYWKTASEYWHMTANNLVLLGAWALMCWAIDPVHFFVVYLATVSIAGAGGIILFTVQHNFEHAYASPTAGWCPEAGALEGTSFLILPAWLNWFTANIGYHHVHHISAAIPNYRLVQCHRENEQLFASVPRVRLSQVPAALKCILWDRVAARIISVGEYHRSRAL
jgi:omega-6 fatty acid desaturase (delta-12 desaturase)